MSEPMATEPTTRLIRASIDLLDIFGTRTDDGRAITAEWGEPIGHCPDGDESIYEPTFTATDDGYLERLRREARAALLDELEAAVRDITERHARLHTCSTKKVHADLRSVLSLIQQHREEGT